MTPASQPYQPIENYGLIGDLYTTALVGMDGSIDFLAFPYFDSPTIFAALLDQQRGGRFQIAPVLEGARHQQLYLPDSNILLTRFMSAEGVAELSDFMPVEAVGVAHNLVRRVKTVRGEVHFRMVCEPRFDYGRAHHRVERGVEEVRFVSEGVGGLVLRLRTSVDIRIENGAAIAEFTLRADEHASFILEMVEDDQESPSAAVDYVSEMFKQTTNFWRSWASRSTYQGRWQHLVTRSALTLKLLVSQPHGSIVAAPTFGLPQDLSGQRNLDLRYTWIRDASFTLYALIRLGYTQEAEAFMIWIEQRCRELRPDGQLQSVYRTNGECDLGEETLSHLEGYRQSGPVYIGSRAHLQLHLDIYGELMDAVYLFNKYGQPISYDLWQNLRRLLDWLCEHWHLPDHGIWQRDDRQYPYLSSRVMCWVAIDRGIRLAMKRSLPAPVDRWYQVRDHIFHDIFTNFWDNDLQAFVQRQGVRTLDAASLLMPLVRFISPTDPRWLSTLNAIGATLVDDTLVHRTGNPDKNTEGWIAKDSTFSACSFWYAECLARAGELDQARLLFEKAMGYANHLGLYSEAIGPCGEHLGNFPQAFTHLSLISAAYDLDRRLTAAGRAE
jgi:GH15 family glucan-1,4-alpha-glucosidase